MFVCLFFSSSGLWQLANSSILGSPSCPRPLPAMNSSTLEWCCEGFRWAGKVFSNPLSFLRASCHFSSFGSCHVHSLEFPMVPPFYTAPLCGHWHRVKGMWLLGWAHLLCQDWSALGWNSVVHCWPQTVKTLPSKTFPQYVASKGLPSLHPSLTHLKSGASSGTLCFLPWNQSSSTSTNQLLKCPIRWFLEHHHQKTGKSSGTCFH